MNNWKSATLLDLLTGKRYDIIGHIVDSEFPYSHREGTSLTLIVASTDLDFSHPYRLSFYYGERLPDWGDPADMFGIVRADDSFYKDGECKYLVFFRIVCSQEAHCLATDLTPAYRERLRTNEFIQLWRNKKNDYY